MSTRPVKVTEHAVERFIERWEPSMSASAARARLLHYAGLATFKEHPPGEPEIWEHFLVGGSILLVVRDGLVETVLPPGAKRPASRRSSRSPR